MVPDKNKEVEEEIMDDESCRLIMKERADLAGITSAYFEHSSIHGLRHVFLTYTFDHHIYSKGAFNNYVDQIFTNFDPLPPSSGQAWTFYIPPPLSTWTKGGQKNTPPKT